MYQNHKKIYNVLNYLELSKHLLFKYKNEVKNENEKKENENEIKAITYLLPITYKLIHLNIINLSINSQNIFEFKKEKEYNDFMNNIENIYKQGSLTLLLSRLLILKGFLSVLFLSKFIMFFLFICKSLFLFFMFECSLEKYLLSLIFGKGFFS